MMTRQFLIMCLVFVGPIMAVGCASGGAIKANAGGSEPLNEEEKVEYQQELVRCHKTGGTRIVKIEGHLRCFN